MNAAGVSHEIAVATLEPAGANGRGVVGDGLIAGAGGAFRAAFQAAVAQGQRGGASAAQAVRDEDEQNQAERTAAHGMAGAPLTIRELNSMLLAGDGPGRAIAQRAETPFTDAAASPASHESAAQVRERDSRAAGSPTSEPMTGKGAEGRPASAESHGERPHAAPKPGLHAGNAAPAKSTDTTGAPQPRAAESTPRVEALAGRFARADAATSGAHAPARAGAPDARPSAGGGTPFTVRAFAGSMSSPRTHTPAQAQSAPALHRADPARQEAFIAQVSRGMHAALTKGEGSITLHLAPRALGDLRVEIGLEKGVVTATFEAANIEARELLSTTLPALRAALEERGLAVERLHVQAAPDGPGEESADARNPAEPGVSGDGGERDGDAPPRQDAPGDPGRGWGPGGAPVSERAEPETDAIPLHEGGRWGGGLVFGIDTLA